jgi:Trk K+ transport system NAD-binding subunit
MRFPWSDLADVFGAGELRQNILALLRYIVFLGVVILLYAVLFQVIMVHVEGQSHSWITAVYWVLITMSTLGFGDVVFASDVGRLFSVGVLISGVVLMLVVLPFTFIRFFYAPWLEAQVRLRAPRRVPLNVRDHVIISRHDEIAAGISEQLRLRGIPCYIIEPDPEKAARLLHEGASVVTGDLDSKATYAGLQAQQARLLLANCEDTTNTNITLTVREMCGDLPIVGIVEHPDSTDILELSGCNHVLPLKVRLGEALANRVSAGLGELDVIGSFAGLQIAEFSARDTPLAGFETRETQLRERTGLNIVGVWDHGHLIPAFPQTPITHDSIVVVVGTPDQLSILGRMLPGHQPHSGAPGLIIGTGTVGATATRTLKRKGLRVHALDRDPHAAEQVRGIADDVFIGDANDREVLERAGLDEISSVLLSTADDAMNVYLAVYLRRLKPELRIVSRITHDRNLEAIHRAGADFVLSYSSLGTEAVVSLIEGHDLVMLGEGVDLFSVPLPPSLENKLLSESRIGSLTGLSVVAIQQNREIVTKLRSEMKLEPGAQLVMLGDAEQRTLFSKAFGGQYSSSPW